MNEEDFYKLINKRMDMLAEHILNGRSPDFPTYRGLTGAYVELRGLKNDVETLLRNLDQDPVD